MRRATQRRANRLAVDAIELAFAAPQVIAHRAARMLTAAAAPSANDQREWLQMGNEKLEAFGEAWVAITLQAIDANQRLVLSMLRWGWMPWIGTLFWLPWAAPRWQTQRAMERIQHAGLGLLTAAMTPVHKRAVANAKRLRRRRR